MTPTIKNSRVALFLVLAASLGLGCSGRKAEWDKGGGTTAPVNTDVAKSEKELGMAAWNERHSDNMATIEAKVREAIAHLEKAADADPSDIELLALVTRANYFLADGFLRSKDAEYLATMDRAVKWGEKAMIAASPAFAEKMRNKGKLPEAVKLIGKDGVPAMYWYSTSLGKWARKSGFAVLVGQKDNVKATMEHVLSLDPNYYHAGPYRYFGAYYAVAPNGMGGDMGKSKESYEKAISLEPRFLGTYVLQAENYATKMDDEALFDSLLKTVLDGDPKAIPEIEAEMRVEQAKATELMAQKEEFF